MTVKAVTILSVYLLNKKKMSKVLANKQNGNQKIKIFEIKWWTHLGKFISYKQKNDALKIEFFFLYATLSEAQIESINQSKLKYSVSIISKNKSSFDKSSRN